MPVLQPCVPTGPVAATTTALPMVLRETAMDRLPAASTATTAAPGAAVTPIPEAPAAAAEAVEAAVAEVHL